MSEIYSQILESIRTTEDRQILYDEIEILSNSLYGKDEQVFEAALNSSVRFWVGEIIKSESQNVGKQDYILNIKNQLDKFESVKLEIAYEPSRSSLDRFHSNLKKYIGKPALLDLSINKHIVGGAVIIYKGNFRDFSMRKLYDAEVSGLKSRVLQILSSHPIVEKINSDVKTQISNQQL